MSSPRSIRLEDLTIQFLADYAARHPGLTSAAAAAHLIEEGLRMDLHPGVVFRDGATGRRARLIGGPDVWEVIGAIRETREAEPTLSADEVLELVHEHSGVDQHRITIAINYYSQFPDEVDQRIDANDRATEDLERQSERARELLGA